MTFGDRDIFEIPVPLSGASFAPIFEWMEAAHWAGGGQVDYWRRFCALGGEEQSRIVAHYRAHHRLEGVIAQDLKRRMS